MDKKKINWWSGGASYDADYQAWLTQVLADGGTDFSSAVKLAQSNMITSLKSAGLWTRMKFGYFLHCGDTTVGRRNIKSPSTFRSSITGTLTFSEGNGTKSAGDGYFNTGYAANQYAGIETDLTIACYISESSTANIAGAAYGTRTGTGGANFRMQLTPKVSTNGNRTHYENGSASWANGNHKGRYVQTYNGGNTIVYKDGVSVASAAVTPTAPDIASKILICARNADGVGNSPTPVEFYTIYDAYIFAFDTFTSSDASALDAIMATYNTAAGLP